MNRQSRDEAIRAAIFRLRNTGNAALADRLSLDLIMRDPNPDATPIRDIQGRLSVAPMIEQSRIANTRDADTSAVNRALIRDYLKRLISAAGIESDGRSCYTLIVDRDGVRIESRRGATRFYAAMPRQSREYREWADHPATTTERRWYGAGDSRERWSDDPRLML